MLVTKIRAKINNYSEMSLSSKSSGTSNPAVKFIKYSSTKSFHYYDKEKKEEVSMPKEFSVIPLDRLATITGWCDDTESNIYSNEVRSTKKEDLVVRSFKGTKNIAKGKYADIKGHLDGGKYTASLYCALIEGDDVSLVNIHLHSSGLSPLFDVDLHMDGQTFVVSQNPEVQKKGAVKYYVPQFIPAKDMTDGKLIDKATELDVTLQAYLTEYFGKQKETEDSFETSSDIQPKTPMPTTIPPEAEKVDNSPLPF